MLYQMRFYLVRVDVHGRTYWMNCKALQKSGPVLYWETTTELASD